MNPLSKAAYEATRRIPPQILKEVFTDKTYNWRDTPITIEEQIKNKVIRSRVMEDCNLVGGTEVLIPLDRVPRETNDSFTYVYYIPKSLTQNRSIMSALSMSYVSSSSYAASAGLYNTTSSGTNSSGSALGGVASALHQAASPIPLMSTARVQLIAENTIMVRDTVPILANGQLRCILANDEDYNNLQMRSVLAFCKLVELAVKSYIYNEYIVRIDQAFLSGGQEIGRFKEIVETYSDAEESYQEYIKKVWGKVSLMNDQESFTRLLKLQIGAYR